ncbi:MAG: chemotaxis protein CheD [Prolixibacteraceae bacterium]|nr:chemotaxis protein CheD [Prolixibacteraceae bacterium]MBN2648685.1 chemotaxis protein CheD [Prolixibacteraceae bacterium]
MDKIKYLKQGELAIVSGDTKVFTILGSCVAVVLWDEQTKIGGVNHYLLPNWNNKGAPDVRYGDVAVTELHDKTILSGAVKRRMVAKIYGGASLLNLGSSTFNIGQRNINIAKEKLKELNIQIIEEEIGGTTGRKILFDPQTGFVKVDLIKNINF